MAGAFFFSVFYGGPVVVHRRFPAHALHIIFVKSAGLPPHIKHRVLPVIQIRSALEAACAWEFVEKLENGMDTEVRERGTRFSEGQKQRLSIARAILADAPVMILDEATSALDVATERRVLRSIIRNEPHRTVIVAAHRPSVFAMCDHVYKVGDHRIEEVDEEGIRRFLDEF